MQGRPGGPPRQSRHLGNDLQLAARGDPLRRVGALCRQYDGSNSDGAGPGAQRSAGRYSRPYRRPLSRTLRRQIAISARLASEEIKPHSSSIGLKGTMLMVELLALAPDGLS